MISLMYLTQETIGNKRFLAVVHLYLYEYMLVSGVSNIHETQLLKSNDFKI